MTVVYANVCGKNMKVKLPLSDCKNLDPQTYVKTKKYKVKIDDNYVDATILHIAETMEELEIFVQKNRCAPPPSSQIMSASDTEEESTLPKKIKLMVGSPKIANVAADIEDASTKGQVTPKPRGRPPNKSKNTLDMPKARSFPPRDRNLVSKFGPPKELAVSHILPDHSKEEQHIGGFKKPGNPVLPLNEIKNWENIPTHTISSNKDREKIKELEEKISHLNNQIEKLQSGMEEKDEEMKVMKDEVKRNDEELKEETRISEGRKLVIFNKEKELNELRSLNREWQRTSIEHMEQIKALTTSLENEKLKTLTDNSKTKPGDLNEAGDLIYAGHNFWLSYDVFKNSTYNTKTYAQVAKNLAIGIFGFATLQAATLTGKGSNRNRGAKFPESKLDGQKMLCLKDIFKYYLLQVLRLDEVIVEEEMDKVRGYVCAKISDLKRQPRKLSNNTPVVEVDVIEIETKNSVELEIKEVHESDEELRADEESEIIRSDEVEIPYEEFIEDF